MAETDATTKDGWLEYKQSAWIEEIPEWFERKSRKNPLDDYG